MTRSIFTPVGASSLPIFAPLAAELPGSTESHPFVEAPALSFQAGGTLDRTAFGQTLLSGMGLGDRVEIEI